MINKLTGTWELAEWDCMIDGLYHSHPYGRDAQGMLQYTADGRMTAILMRRERPLFNASSMVRGTDVEKLAAVDGYVSYAGSYRVVGDEVVHSVKYSLFPNWIHTDLVRTVGWTEDTPPQLILTTKPQITSSGKSVVNRLRWERIEKGTEQTEALKN